MLPVTGNQLLHMTPPAASPFKALTHKTVSNERLHQQPSARAEESVRFGMKGGKGAVPLRLGMQECPLICVRKASASLAWVLPFSLEQQLEVKYLPLAWV